MGVYLNKIPPLRAQGGLTQRPAEHALSFYKNQDQEYKKRIEEQ